jgi:hypothetical protein
MNRRTFLGALPLSAAAVNLPEGGSCAPLPDLTRANSGRPELPPGLNYFTSKKLESLVDTSVSLKDNPFEAVAFNFPNYHPSSSQERYLGKGWTEWELMERAKPMFEGHLQPKQCLWGEFNEADPAWAELEIETASSYGISTFAIDWFWYNGIQVLHEQLEQGFLKARNRTKLRFCIMWANISWRNQYPPPDSAYGYNDNPVLYEQTYSDADMDRVAEYWLEHYFREPNYWRLDGQPVVQIFDVVSLLKYFGVEKLRATFDRMRDRVARAGQKGIHFQAALIYAPGVTPFKAAGFDSATHYHTFGGGNDNPGKTSQYGAKVEQTIHLWKETADKLEIPYFPDCPVGWDDSPRYASHSHIVVNRSPDQYELFMEAAKHFVAGRKTQPPIIFLSSWNEWSEDHCLLPDTAHGYSYLEAVGRQFSR